MTQFFRSLVNTQPICKDQRLFVMSLTNTRIFLPICKGWNYKIGHNRKLLSWISNNLKSSKMFQNQDQRQGRIKEHKKYLFIRKYNLKVSMIVISMHFDNSFLVLKKLYIFHASLQPNISWFLQLFNICYSVS